MVAQQGKCMHGNMAKQVDFMLSMFQNQFKVIKNSIMRSKQKWMSPLSSLLSLALVIEGFPATLPGHQEVTFASLAPDLPLWGLAPVTRQALRLCPWSLRG